MNLFRSEVAEKAAQRYDGDALVVPTRLQSIFIAILFAWLVSLIFFLIFADYAKQETLRGWLDPESGTARIYADRAGLIADTLVAQGDRVTRGQALLHVRVDRSLANGASLDAVLAAEQQTQKRLLEDQLARTERSLPQEQRDIETRIAALEGDLVLQREQEQALERQYGLAVAQHARVAELREQGHVSQTQLIESESAELELLNRFHAAKREVLATRSALEGLRIEAGTLVDRHAERVTEIRTAISEVNQSLARLDFQSDYIIRSPIDGTVADLQVSLGQRVTTQTPVVSVVPEDATFSVSLAAPIRAVSQLEPGQTVKLRYDAYSYQKYGVFPATITAISDVALLPNELVHAPIALREPVYRISAELDSAELDREIVLRPGMTLTADVKVEERRLIDWLLNPFVSLLRRA